jgi:hypothetical protein
MYLICLLICYIVVCYQTICFICISIKSMSDSADHDHKTSSNADASFCCAYSGQESKSIQVIKEHKSNLNEFKLKWSSSHVSLLDRLKLLYVPNVT